MQRNIVWVVLVCCVILGTSLAMAQETFQGVVFEDTNGNGVRDTGEKGIPGVCVSNGVDVVQTDGEGRYTLPQRGDMNVFVIKPADYNLPVNEHNLPQFSYIHRPNGSPDFIQDYQGFAPTGALPSSVDFPLLPGTKSDSFTMIAIGDTQVTDHREISYLRDSLVKELQGTDASFGLVLGDNVNDVLGLYDRYLQVMGEMGIPLFYVLGNHDMNFYSQDDFYSAETFTKLVMPPYYAFNVGKVHFVVLDSVIWDGKGYYGGISEDQLAFLKNDLALVPAENLVVIAMHIPLISYMDRNAEKHQVKNREDLFQILEGRKVLFLAGHTHTLERFYPDTTIDGWSPNLPFPQIIPGAACGSWWSGPKEEYGIPFAYQRDAAPKGYMIFEFQGTEWKETYKVVGRAIDSQINISFFMSDRVERRLKEPALPEGTFLKGDLLGTHVVANVFCDAVEVSCTVDGQETMAMTRRSLPDPMMNWYAKDLPDWMRPVGSTHTFSASLPSTLEPGIHTVIVTAKDRFGRTYQCKRLLEVW